MKAPSRRWFFGFLPAAALSATAAKAEPAIKDRALYIDGVKVLELYKDESGADRISLCCSLGVSKTFRKFPS